MDTKKLHLSEVLMRSIILVTITTYFVLFVGCKSLNHPKTAENDVCELVSDSLPYLPDGRVKVAAVSLKAGCDEQTKENDAGSAVKTPTSIHSDAGPGSGVDLTSRH